LTSVIKTDVLIVGAGPAGSSAALFLAKNGISSVIIDKEKFPRDKICGDAISGKAVEVLNKLNPKLVNELSVDKHALGSWGVTFVAPSGQALRVPFVTKKLVQKAPGFICKRIDFDNWLVEKVREDELVSLYEETEIRNYTRENGLIKAVAKNGAEFITKIVIACDGAYSTFARHVGLLQTEPAHNCFGLRAYCEGVDGLDSQGFIELHFLKEILPGYFWIFPLANGAANVGIGMRADKVTGKKINLKKAFEKVLAENPVMQKRFANYHPIGNVKQFGLPLGSKKRKISGYNYMLCGDAAQLIDPFTGEGIGNAMMSGMYAANQAAACLNQANFSQQIMARYDEALYSRLWSELLLSYRLQQLANYPSLFNYVVSKANSNVHLRETISCMFEDLDLRARLKNPAFYFKLLFS
jgi:geranylgeranyl reductase family protein